MKYEKNDAVQEPVKIHWGFDPVHCSIRFVACHLFLSEIEGVFLFFTGKVTSDDEAFANAAIVLEIDAASIKTNSDIRDNNLRSDNFFNTALYPKISFQSLSLQRVLGYQYKLVGQLTIRDSTKTIEFDVQQHGIVVDPDGRTKLVRYVVPSTVLITISNSIGLSMVSSMWEVRSPLSAAQKFRHKNNLCDS